MTNHFLRSVLTIVFAPFLFMSSPLHAFDTDLQRVGAGEMRWHFLALYDAEFLSQSGTGDSDYPVALKLIYKRDISSKNLLKATAKEWERMHVQHADVPAWLKRLEFIWPDVVRGDDLTCYVSGSGHAHFYLNGRPIGVLEDAEFAKQFLAIWLSPKAKDQDLRKKLLGAA